jgi:NTP pyrophosphatase (non-canonical NTP hydrolase)
MLMVTELSEACESLRHGNPPGEHIGNKGFTQVEEELADVVIRLMDFSVAKGYAVGDAIIAKMAFNRTREYKHNKEF